MDTLTEFIKNNRAIDLNREKNSVFIKELQRRLIEKGYSAGSIDGIVGTNTLKAWARFKKDNYLDQPELVGASSLKLLLELPDRSTGFFQPTNGIGWISSPFGPRARGNHKGIDIAADTGVAVYAIADGTAVTVIRGCRVGDFSCGGGYGNVVYINHPNGSQSRYAHLSVVERDLQPNSPVKRGQKIGAVGDTGHSFGPHLHFEYRDKGVAIDPLLKINPIV